MRMQRLFVSFVAFCGVLMLGHTAWAQPAQGVVSPTSFDFGDVHLGTATTTTTFTVSNTGGSDYTISSFVASGAACGDYQISPAAPQTIAAGAATEFTVAFDPTARDARDCSWTLADDDNDADTFDVTGFGRNPNMATSTTGLAFGNVHVSSPSQLTFSVTNLSPSNDPLEVTAALSGTGQAAYQVSPTSATILVGATQVFTVTFTPTARTSYAATVTISGDDDANPSDTVSLSGTGTAPVMSVSPLSLSCGSARVNGGVQTCDITIQNTTTDAGEVLTWSASVLTGGSDFSISTLGDTTLTPGQSTTTTIAFDPTVAGTRSGSVQITGDAPANPDDTVSLSGTGTVSILSLSPSPLAFGSVHVNTNSSQTLVIDNTATLPGAHDLSVTAMSITGTNASDFAFTDHGCSGQTCTLGSPIVVSPGADLENVVIRCRPSSRGNKTATLTVTGDQDSGASTVTLTCTGTEPEINVTDTALAFGTAIVGGSEQLTFSIQNTFTGTGQETLDYTITKGGANPGVFTVSPACTSNCTVGPGLAQIITVTFSPTARQDYSATLTIASDDIDEPSIVVTLSGTGVAPVIGNPSPSSQALAFGAVDVGTTSSSMTATIQNVGDSPLNVTSVSLVGANANQFTITSGTTGAHSVAVGGTDAWGVACRPTSFGAKSATLRIASDALGATSFDFALTCTGQQAVFTFSPAGGLDFGGVFVGQSSTLSVTITNAGNKAGDVQSIMSGNSVFTFAVVGGAPPRTVAPNGSLTVDVTFTPVDGSVVSTNLTVTTTGSPASFNIPLLGDGRTQGVDISVVNEADLMVDLGEVRVGNLVQKQVIVQNSGDTAYTLTLPSSNDSQCTVQLVNPLSYPAVVPGGGTAVFNVNTTPDSLGAGSCVVTVASSIPTTDTITFTFVGVAPDIELVNPVNGVLDYAGVDVDASQMQTVTVRNTGSFPLTISSCTLSGSARFSLATDCGTPISVAEAQSTALNVLFDPTVEAVETATLTLAVDAIDVSQVQIELRGVGVDQHIDIPNPVVTFPPTFRNPDPDDTPVQMVVVVNPKIADPNNPGAPLTVSMAVTEDAFDEVFVVENPGPYTVQPDGQIEVPVLFRPTAAGTPFSAQMTIFNDTSTNPMATVTLTGEGISRLVDVAPRNVADFGRTGVGVPVRLSEVLGDVRGISISNIDPSGEPYQIRALAFADTAGDPIEYTGPFRLVATDARELAANASETYDVEFVPDAAGTYTVLLGVYLDGDPKAHSTVMLRGEAVEIDLSGGGGCQAGRTGGWGGLVVLALALFGLRRRRTAAALALVAALAVATPAQADTTRNMDIATFAPAPATEVETFTVESPQVGVSGAWAIDLVVSHATNILRATPNDGTGGVDGTDVPVTARTSLQVGFAYAFADMFEVGVRLPFFSQSGDAPGFSGLTPADGTAIGDVAAHVKARLLGGAALSLAASLDVTAPTATDEIYAGSDAVSAHARAIAGWKSRRLGLNGNVGFVARPEHDLGNRVQGNAISYGAGAWVRTLDRMWVIGEVFGTSGMGPTGEIMRDVEPVSQLEGVLGMRYEIAQSIGVSVGAGRGIVPGIGTPDFRGFLLVDVAPRAREHGPLVVRVPPPPRDLRDNDNDAVVNADDQCPDDAEDLDGWQDEDGCPDADNDGDGLLDDGDKCPSEGEDADGFQDEDGCVDRDNDNDKIADVDDKCPGEAEDFDGHMDSDGCDDPDNDFDGIPDVIDQCALEPETINGKADDDGCPDEGESLVMVMPDRIEIFEPVAFEGTGAKLSRRSSKVLGQVAATLRANRDFVRVRVTVHVHPRGGKDQELSEKRAKAVRDWLVQWGIEPERVELRGLGSSRPLVPKSQKGAAKLNDRVEFIILEKTGK